MSGIFQLQGTECRSADCIATRGVWMINLENGGKICSVAKAEES